MTLDKLEVLRNDLHSKGKFTVRRNFKMKI